MKQLLALGLFVFAFALTSAGSSADLFKLDEAQVKTEMQEIDELEAFFYTNGEVTLSEINTTPSLQVSLSQETLNLVGRMSSYEPPLGVPSFCWGGCLGFFGILMVYILSDQDNGESKKALYGCLTQGVCVLFFYVGYYIFLLNYAAY